VTIRNGVVLLTIFTVMIGAFFAVVIYDIWVDVHYGPSYTASWTIALLSRHPVFVCMLGFILGTLFGFFLFHFFKAAQPDPRSVTEFSASKKRRVG
jgi:hypothetical protein